MKQIALFLVIALLTPLLGGCNSEKNTKTVYVLTAEVHEQNYGNTSSKIITYYQLDKKHNFTQADALYNGQTYCVARYQCGENGLIAKKTQLQFNGSFWMKRSISTTKPEI